MTINTEADVNEWTDCSMEVPVRECTGCPDDKGSLLVDYECRKLPHGMWEVDLQDVKLADNHWSLFWLTEPRAMQDIELAIAERLRDG